MQTALYFFFGATSPDIGSGSVECEIDPNTILIHIPPDGCYPRAMSNDTV
jgi:hypothetical protein